QLLKYVLARGRRDRDQPGASEKRLLVRRAEVLLVRIAPAHDDGAVRELGQRVPCLGSLVVWRERDGPYLVERTAAARLRETRRRDERCGNCVEKFPLCVGHVPTSIQPSSDRVRRGRRTVTSERRFC